MTPIEAVRQFTRHDHDSLATAAQEERDALALIVQCAHELQIAAERRLE